MKVAGYRAVLRNPHFLILWSNQIIQQFTFGILNFALVLLVYGLTQSNLAVALVFFALASPVFLFGMFAGVVADLVDRRGLMMLTNLGMSLAILLLLLAKERLFSTLAVAFLISTINQFFLPTESASIPMIVKKNELINANSLFTITLFAAQIGGLVVGGPLILKLGFTQIFIVLSIFLFLAFLLVQFLPPLVPNTTSNPSFQKLSGLFINLLEVALTRIVAGLRFIANKRRVAVALLSLGLMEAVLAMLAVLSVGFVKEVLATEPNLLAVILVPPAGLGFAGGALLVARIAQLIRKEQLVLGGIGGMGTALILLSFLPKLVLTTVGFRWAVATIASLGFLVGLFAVMVTVPARTLIQEETPLGTLGRVFSVLAILTAIGASGPILLASSLADAFGVEVVMGGVGVVVLLSGLILIRGLLRE